MTDIVTCCATMTGQAYIGFPTRAISHKKGEQNQKKKHTREAHLLLVLTLSQKESRLRQPHVACMHVHSKHRQEAAKESDDPHDHEELLR
jgi:hypothetical protein